MRLPIDSRTHSVPSPIIDFLDSRFRVPFWQNNNLYSMKLNVQQPHPSRIHKQRRREVWQSQFSALMNSFNVHQFPIVLSPFNDRLPAPFYPHVRQQTRQLNALITKLELLQFFIREPSYGSWHRVSVVNLPSINHFW